MGHLRNKSLVPRIPVPNSKPKTKKENPDLTGYKVVYLYPYKVWVYPYKIIHTDLINQSGMYFKERYFKYGPDKVDLFFPMWIIRWSSVRSVMQEIQEIIGMISFALKKLRINIGKRHRSFHSWCKLAKLYSWGTDDRFTGSSSCG